MAGNSACPTGHIQTCVGGSINGLVEFPDIACYCLQTTQQTSMVLTIFAGAQVVCSVVLGRLGHSRIV